MRSLQRESVSALALALVLTAPSCDSTQPLQVTEQVASILITSNALVQIYDVYDVMVDTTQPPDGVPDVMADFAECREVKDSEGKPVFAPRVVPWKVAVEIRVLPAGSTTPEILLSSFDRDNPFTSVLDYDTVVQGAGPAPPSPPFYYVNGERLSKASRRYLERCAGQFGLPDPNILDNGIPLELPLRKGDTIIVQARKQLERDSTLEPPRLELASQPVISVEIVIDGRTVTLQGSASSTVESGAGFSASYTLR